MAVRVMIMAGGTGGHVFPALAVEQYLEQAGHNVTWLGTRKGIEAKVVPEAGIEIDWLNVTGLRGKGVLSLILAPFMLLKACWQAYQIVKQRNPDVVLGLGGFASGPGGLMSWVLGKPLVIHEQNRVPGTTNRLLTRVATTILEAFPQSYPDEINATFTGNPIRKAMLGISAKPSQGCQNILVIGGSLGAAILNQTVPGALKILSSEMQLNVIHQTGSTTFDEAIGNYKQVGIDADIRPFIEDMKAVYEWADLVICRAGAMTISELAVAGLPAILVPLPHAIDDHQTKNAEYLSNDDAAILIRQKDLTADSLASCLNELLSDVKKLNTMSMNAKKLAKPEATELVANACLELAA
jgi:UDP-N-acetylglucosamine--N-acetylmuramyl-(pentapeptide) pyrophosphoryl-undecaprenol N-acetylglucosamine transferase